MTRDREMRQWAMWMHLSLLAGYLLPFFGFAVPVALWRARRDTSATIDRHGRNILNWITTQAAIFPLCVFLVVAYRHVALTTGSVAVLVVLAITVASLPVVGAIKAARGVVYRYSLAVPFFG